jgi:hypothetical protein
MKGWKKYSPFVEIDSDLTLKQVQEGLVEAGNTLLNPQMLMPFMLPLKISRVSWMTVLNPRIFLIHGLPPMSW